MGFFPLPLLAAIGGRGSGRGRRQPARGRSRQAASEPEALLAPSGEEAEADDDEDQDDEDDDPFQHLADMSDDDAGSEDGDPDLHVGADEPALNEREELAAQAVDEGLRLLEEVERQGGAEVPTEAEAVGSADEPVLPPAEHRVPPPAADEDGAGEAGRLLNGLGLGWARAPGIAEIRFSLGRNAGEFRYSITSDYIRAYCPLHENCTRQRSTREHPSGTTKLSLGQGRPIGALYAWILDARNHDSQSSHVKAKAPNLLTRIAARDAFELLDGGEEFAREHERPCRPGEDTEPEQIR